MRMGEPEYASQRHICHAFLSEGRTSSRAWPRRRATPVGGEEGAGERRPPCSRNPGARESPEPGDADVSGDRDLGADVRPAALRAVDAQEAGERLAAIAQAAQAAAARGIGAADPVVVDADEQVAVLALHADGDVRRVR